MNTSMTVTLLRHGAIVQGRVLSALMLREIHTINGNSKLGYLWVLIQSVFSIAVFWGIREYMGAHAPHGISMPLFLAVGFGLWGIFSGTINKTMSAVEGNRALLSFPQVTELDVMIGRMLVIAATQYLTILLIVGADALVANPLEISSIFTALSVIILLPLLSLGIGMILGALAVFLPVLEKLVPMVLRIAFFVSGVFFSVSAFKQDVAEILLWNPVFNAIELLRMSLYAAYKVDGLSLNYLAVATIVSLSFGMLFERYVRARRKS